MNNRTRNIIIIAVVVVALGLVVWLSSSAARSTSDLSSSLRRRSPVTDYITHSFGHEDCARSIEDRFLAHVAAAITIDPTNVDGRKAAAEQIAADGAALSKIEELCPTPPAPIFNDDGDLVGYTTSTTLGGSG